MRIQLPADEGRAVIVEFVAEHPGVPRMIFGKLQRAEATPAKRMVQTLLKSYAERLHGLIEKAKSSGELTSSLDNEAAATLFIGTIQGLVMQQSLLTGNIERIPALWATGTGCCDGGGR